MNENTSTVNSVLKRKAARVRIIVWPVKGVKFPLYNLYGCNRHLVLVPDGNGQWAMARVSWAWAWVGVD